ncbi:MAG: TRAP transporter large permease [Fretibacterium sp.]|nr:TRAP transporter large permease [Fretibacterium sp.]
MLGFVLVVLFIVFVAVGVPIAFSLGVVSFTGIAFMPAIPNTVVFTKMFNGLNSFTLLAIPLFILAANLMNESGITEKLIECICDLVGHWKGGLAYANVLVSMVFAGISGSSQADTSGVGKIFIPAMEKQGYDKGTSVGVTAASSTLGSIIPPSITMVVYSGIAGCSTGALFISGIVPGILLGLAQMAVIRMYAGPRNFPQSKKVPFKIALKHTLISMPALLTPIILIGGIVSGFFTPTESAAFACIYALLVGMFFYRSITLSRLPHILIETMKMASLSLFALATANALGELLSYYQLNVTAQQFFTSLPGGRGIFLLVTVLFFLFVGTFMDGIPAMILFVPIILPSAIALDISPIILGLIIIVTLALGLVTPPYGLCLLLASSISGTTIEEGFRGTLPYFLSSLAVLLLLVLFPDFWLAIPRTMFGGLF